MCIALLFSLPLHAKVDQPTKDSLPQLYVQAQEALYDNPPRALEIAKSLPKLPLVDDLRLRLLADAEAKNGAIQDALKSLKELQAISSTAEQAEIRLERAELFFLAADLNQTENLLKKLPSKAFRSFSSRERRHLNARTLRLRHDLLRAIKNDSSAKSIAIQLLIYYPAEDATKRSGLAATITDLSIKQQYRRTKSLYETWQYDEAREAYRTFQKHKTYQEEADWYIALIGFRKLRDKTEEALTLFKKLSKQAKGTNRQAESTYYHARALMKLEQYKEALAVFDNYEKRFPKGNRIQEVHYYRGWLPYDHRQNDQAIKGFKAYIKKYGRKSRRSSYVYGYLAWAYMRKQDWNAAIDAWNDLLPFGNPLVAGKAMFWRAFALDKLNKREQAVESLDRLRKAYPLTYYQMLGEQLRSRFETGSVQPASTLWWPKRKAPADDTPRVDLFHASIKGLSKAEEKLWRRVKELARFQEQHIARKEVEPILKKILSSAPKGHQAEWIHALGQLIGNYNLGWKEATGGSLNALTNRLPDAESLKWIMAYPRAYPEIVSNVAHEFKIPEIFVWSIMRQESRYKPGAISHTDAVGALQMIPSTAEKIAAELGTVFRVRTFFRPQVGFRYSAFYMNKLLTLFSGLFLPAAGAYNTGPAPLAHWFKKNPKASFPWLVEEFEYNEGRAYSRKVTEHMTRYVYLYVPDHEQGALLDRLYPVSRNIEIPDEVGY